MNMLNTLKTKTAKAIIIAIAASGIGMGTVAFAQENEEAPAKTKRLSKKQRRAKFKNMTPEQRKAFHAERLNKRMARLTKKLNLSDTQAKQLRTTYESMHKEIVQARQQNPGDRKAKRAAMQKIRKAYKPEVAKILTQEQLATFEDLKKKRKARKMKRRGRKHRAHKMAKALNLSADQKTKLKAIRVEHRKQAKALIAGANGDRSKVKPQLKALRQAKKQKVVAILTPEQQQKLKTLRQNRKKGLNKDAKTKGPF